MKMICKGCFTHLSDGMTNCPRCGWNEKLRYAPGFRWEMSEVVDGRYMMGSVYYVSGLQGIAVFRAFDNALKQQVFILILRSKKREDYAAYAGSLLNSSWAKSFDLAVLALKDIKGEPAVVFSLKDIYADENAFEKQLMTKAESAAEEEPAKEDTEREQTLPPGSILDRHYKVLSCIGIGGFGITYLCEDIHLHRKVAVKEYFPAEWALRDEKNVSVRNARMVKAFRFGLTAFYREIEISAHFIHTPHLITVLDTFAENDTAYMVMEYIDGISMGRWLKMREYKPFSKEEIAPVLCAVLDVLSCMHEKKIIHSDISPGNILYTQDHQVYVIDLGAAKYLKRKENEMHTVFLKPEYASPEQFLTARDKRPLGEGPWTDLYGLGATAYYLLTGEKPVDVVTRLKEGADQKTNFAWDKLPEGFEPLLKKALEMDYNMRYSSAAIMRQELEKRILAN